MWWALLRISEVIKQKNTPNRCLKLSDLSIKKKGVTLKEKIKHGDRLELRIRSSKTDTTGVGSTHWFGPSAKRNGPLEAAILLKQFGKVQGKEDSCSIEDLTDPPISNQDILSVIHSVDRRLSTHSMRRGGAVQLAKSNIPWPSTKVLGRWKSDTAPQLYTRNHAAMNIDRVKTVYAGRVIES